MGRFYSKRELMSEDQHRFCLDCGYCLDSLESDICPECGGQFNAKDPYTFATSAGTAHWLRWQQRVLLLAGLLVPLDLLCALLSYETIAEVHMHLLLFVAVVGNLLACALLIIPHQLALGIQYLMITHEAKQIVEYVDQSIVSDGKPPADLSAYSYRFPSVRDHFIAYTLDKKNGGYRLSWYIGNRGASHWYSPNEGRRYYPD